MGLAAFVKDLYIDRDIVVARPAEVYDVAAHNLFTVTGACLVTLLGGIATAAAGGAATMATTLNGVAGEAAAVAINGAVGTVWCTPLNVAGVIAAAAGALPLTDALLHPKGMVVGIGAAANGVIIGTVAVATWTGIIYCMYRPLHPGAEIYPA